MKTNGKKTMIVPLARIAITICCLLLLILFAIFLAQKFPPPPLIPTPTPEISQSGQIFLTSGQPMTSDKVTLSNDITSPLALLLPLKTLADFPDENLATAAAILTNKGNLQVTLYANETPLTVANFLSLAQNGFYDQLKFHRLEPNFIAQIGDSASKDASTTADLAQLGAGYPGYRITDEISPNFSHDQIGVLSMANINLDGQYPHTAGSQFFITLTPAPHLDGRHAIFGQVTNGFDVLSALELGDEIISITII
jgi:peptidyl-prolyl cis-trans isomerase B (cyclophilin B)